MKKQLPHGVAGLAIGSILLLALLVFALMPAGKGAGLPPGKRTGRAAPDFTLKTIDGKPVSLASLKGKVVLLNFWATWCGPCRQELPSVVKLYEKYHDRGFEVVAVSADTTAADVRAFTAENPLPFPIALPPREMPEAYDVHALPTSVLIDRNGQIVFDIDGYDPALDFGALIEKQLVIGKRL